MNNLSYAFLGKGIAFPPTFNPNHKDMEYVTGEIDVRQSLEIILGTRRGERPLELEFGCNLDALLYEPLTLTFTSFMSELIAMALTRYEPRIELNELKIERVMEQEGLIQILVDYTIPAINTRYNLVYPFYLS